MSNENHRIEKYQYDVRADAVDGKVRDVSLLYLYGGDRTLLAVIAFIAGSETLQKPYESPNGHVSVQMHADRHPMVIDMLRNEKPVYFSWSPDREAIRLTTREEPVGEQELKRLFSWLYL